MSSRLRGGMSNNGLWSLLRGFSAAWFKREIFLSEDKVWQDTEVVMPDGAPAQWRNVITSEVLSAARHCLSERYYSVSQWHC